MKTGEIQERSGEIGEVGAEDPCGGLMLEREGGLRDVGGGGPVVDPGARLSGLLREGPGDRHDVVLELGLERIDTGQGHLRAAGGPLDGGPGLHWDPSELRFGEGQRSLHP